MCYYDGRGRFLLAAGRQGKGPDEFSRLRWLGLDRDSVLSYDFNLQRISVYSEAGRLESLIRRAVPPRPVTSADMDAYIHWRQSYASNANDRRAPEEEFRKKPHAATKPAYSGFRVDALGDLWVGHYVWIGLVPTRWTVFDPTGRLLGDVAVPPHFTVYQIGGRYVLGMRADSLGVQRVELYALKKP